MDRNLFLLKCGSMYNCHRDGKKEEFSAIVGRFCEGWLMAGIYYNSLTPVEVFRVYYYNLYIMKLTKTKVYFSILLLCSSFAPHMNSFGCSAGLLQGELNPMAVFR